MTRLYLIEFIQALMTKLLELFETIKASEKDRSTPGFKNRVRERAAVDKALFTGTSRYFLQTQERRKIVDDTHSELKRASRKAHLN